MSFYFLNLSVNFHYKVSDKYIFNGFTAMIYDLAAIVY